VYKLVDLCIILSLNPSIIIVSPSQAPPAESRRRSRHGWITRRWTSETVDFGATGLHCCSPGWLLARVSAEERILETDKEYFPIPGLGILLYALVQI
jgi:hypothetical protein